MGLRLHTALQPLALRYAAVHCTAPPEIGMMGEVDSMFPSFDTSKYRMAGCGCEWKAEPRLGATRLELQKIEPR